LAETQLIYAALFTASVATYYAVRTNPSGVESAVREVGEVLSCSLHRTACLLSGLASKKGGKWGQSRCDLCYDACVRNEGIWPTDVRTSGRSLDCEYKLYPSE
jgi:hypothetical protein